MGIPAGDWVKLKETDERDESHKPLCALYNNDMTVLDVSRLVEGALRYELHL